MMLSLSLSLSKRGGVVDRTPAAPSLVGATITGTPEVGEVLGVSVNYTGYPAPSISYQWTRDGSDISGATSSTYTLVEADEGTDVGVDIGLTNSEGSDSGASNEVTVSAAPSGAFSTAFSSAFDAAA